MLGETISGIVGGIGDAIAKPTTAIGDAINNGKQLDNAPGLAQVSTNNIEAASASWWDRGWRPAVGWVCAACLGLYYIPQFLIADFLWVKICIAHTSLAPFPVNSGDLMQLLLALLGMGSLRTWEKFIGVNKNG